MVPDIDTSYIDLQYNTWSIRTFSTVKYHSFSLRNDKNRVRYVPNDLQTVGLGFTYKFLLVDIGLRLKKNKEDHSKRFDIQTSAHLGPHLVGLNAQAYGGFDEVVNGKPFRFRDNVKIISVNINYLYLSAYKKTSARVSQWGIGQQKKRVGSLLFGGFIGNHVMKADSSFIPQDLQDDFEEIISIRKLQMRNLGIQAGYFQIIPISKNFFVAGYLTPGVGLYWGSTKNEEGEKSYVNSTLIKLDAFFSAGYNYRSFYTVINYNIDANYLPIEEDTRYNYSLSKIKLAIGLKFPLKNNG